MALPDLIEIVPLTEPVRAEITVPGSKSITNRALILAALADGTVTLTGALWSEDTQIVVECLEKLGFELRVEQDPEEFCNRTITVKGLGGKIPRGGTAEKPLELFVGNAGTAARFLSAFVCLGDGVYRLSGIPRMNERPKAALFQALRELGYRVESEKKNEKLPVVISGSRRRKEADPGEKIRLVTSAATVDISESSQFASALLLCAKVGGWKIEVTGENAEESPYVAMTSKLIEAFPGKGGKFQIEPDASSGSYFWAADWLQLGGAVVSKEPMIGGPFKGVMAETHTFSNIAVRKWPTSGWQIDENFPEVISLGETHRLILEAKKRGDLSAKLPELAKRSFKTAIISRELDLGDSIMTAIVLSSEQLLACSTGMNQFTDLGRLRLQECERVVALRTELTKCGAKVEEQGDALTVYPSPLHGAEIETYNDHRMAMCFAILGLKVPGIKLKNPACVKKTFPNFFQKLATPPPKGLGATILDAKTGRKLAVEELFAD